MRRSRSPVRCPPGVLAAHYRHADVFVCLSEHEGFCVPLLEAMHHGLPVIAYAAAAVPETLGGAGLLLTDKSPATVAAAIHTVGSDTGAARRAGGRGSHPPEGLHPRTHPRPLCGAVRPTCSGEWTSGERGDAGCTHGFARRSNAHRSPYAARRAKRGNHALK